jgi:plasmid stability protein
MKATFDLSDDLVRAMKIRAAEQGRKLKDVVEELLRGALALSPPPSAVPRRVQLPLVSCVHEARTGSELTPERVAELLLGEEARYAADPP